MTRTVSAHLERARLLLGQSRYDMAATELQQELAANPEHPVAHALLALALSAQEAFEDATEHVREAIALAPAFDYAHYVHASVLEDRCRYAEAEEAIREAIRLDPEDPDYHACHGQILLHRREWSEALAAAERGLAIDAEHVGAANVRVHALTRLGRHAEAQRVSEDTLRRAPENAYTHSAKGWSLLSDGKPKEAMEHFREALRLEPHLEPARAGMVEAIKAKNVLYRALLRYFLFMSRLSHGAQWGVLIGLWLAHHLARAVPGLEPVTYIYLAFVLTTWTGGPLSNLCLRLHPVGRMALSKEERTASNWIGSCFGVAAASALWGAFFDSRVLLFSFGTLFLVIPLASLFHCSPGWPRIVMSLIAGGLALADFGGLAAALAGDESMSPVASILFLVTLLGCLLSSWVGNALQSVTVKR